MIQKNETRCFQRIKYFFVCYFGICSSCSFCGSAAKLARGSVCYLVAPVPLLDAICIDQYLAFQRRGRKQIDASRPLARRPRSFLSMFGCVAVARGQSFGSSIPRLSPRHGSYCFLWYSPLESVSLSSSSATLFRTSDFRGRWHRHCCPFFSGVFVRFHLPR
jgi:hypothetical protein